VHAVLYEEVFYPADSISERARSFLQGVLQKNPDKRLDDEDAIKKHPFFTGIDWEKLSVKKVLSPFKVAPVC
jgi:serine/threonine protein kinase